jgi:hypothetical protein
MCNGMYDITCFLMHRVESRQLSPNSNPRVSSDHSQTLNRCRCTCNVICIVSLYRASKSRVGQVSVIPVVPGLGTSSSESYTCCTLPSPPTLEIRNIINFWVSCSTLKQANSQHNNAPPIRCTRIPPQRTPIITVEPFHE